MPGPIITLTTDFAEDYFTGVMKGVIACINPDAQVIDVTDAITPGDVRAGAFALLAACGYFPEGTIHIVVVDPGVGSTRKVLCVETERGVYLAPDNGILSWALTRDRPTRIYAVENDRYFLNHVSCTFHGRDVFAPAAAHLSLGVRPKELGPVVSPDDMTTLDFPEVVTDETGTLRGEILYVDGFGNCITNIPGGSIASADPAAVRVETTALCIEGLHRTYADVDTGTVLALIGSAGFLEIATSAGNAAQRFGLKPGDTVVVETPQ